MDGKLGVAVRPVGAGHLYAYKEKNKYSKLLYTIGKLKGLADALEIYNVGVKNLEFKNFIKIQKSLINKLKKL